MATREWKWIMTTGLITTALTVGAVLPATAAPPPAATANAASQAYQSLVDTYFDDYLRGNPTTATYLGVHTFDHLLEDYSRAAIDEDIRSTRRYLQQFEALNPQTLNPDELADRAYLMATLRGALLEAEVIRKWETDPDRYSSGISAAIFTLMGRNFAPPEARLKSVIARQKQVPQVLAAARANLKNPPQVFTEVAIEQLPDIIHFFQNDVPAAFASVNDPTLQSEFKASNQVTISALESYLDWLKTDLLPRSKGDYRLGAEVYAAKLKHDEMVDLPLDKLLEVGMADLKRNQEHFKRAAAELDPNKTPEEVLALIGKDHPAPEQLLQSFRDVLGGIQSFIQEHKILTIPSPVLPQITETPSFMRALTFASMDTPGPFEPGSATEAYFNVTLPDLKGTPEEIADYMSAFNYGVIMSTAIHEAYPGHYIQFLWAKYAPSKVRKILGAASNFEGWAHYCEQMMLDEGFGNNDPKLRLGQLQDALLRNARYVVGIQLHTGKMTFDEAVEFFVKEGYQSRSTGLMETKRGTADPTYLYYTLGKLQLQKLRADYAALKGKDFSLQEFHDRFLQAGPLPIALIRRLMLGETGTVL
jgi:uncharacterized protein (DUF885 family)